MRLFITRDFLIRRSAAQREKVSRPVQINLEKPGGFPMSFSAYLVKICHLDVTKDTSDYAPLSVRRCMRLHVLFG